MLVERRSQRRTICASAVTRKREWNDSSPFKCRYLQRVAQSDKSVATNKAELVYWFTVDTVTGETCR